MEFADKVAQRAATYKPARALLTLIALPFYLVGFVVAVLWVAATWVYAAGVSGFFTAIEQARKDSES